MKAPAGQLTASPLQAQLADGTLAGDWVLDPRRSSARLRTTAFFGLAPVNGVFRELRGSAAIAPDGQVSGTFTVAAASVDTNNARRDRHLRSATFLAAGDNPDITFRVSDIRLAGHNVVVAGALTVRDRTRPLSFDAAVSVPADGELCLDAGVRVDRAEFGLTWNPLGLISTDNTLTVHAVFTRPEGTGSRGARGGEPADE